MIPVDASAKKFREAVASGGSFRNARRCSFLPACGAQGGNAREFVLPAQIKPSEIETTDEHR
jgi:hypothetical protein